MCFVDLSSSGITSSLCYIKPTLLYKDEQTAAAAELEKMQKLTWLLTTRDMKSAPVITLEAMQDQVW
jgi:hypothetical protein